MDNLYSYEQMIADRRHDVAANLGRSRLQRAALSPDPRQQVHRLLDELTSRRHIMRLGRIVIMW